MTTLIAWLESVGWRFVAAATGGLAIILAGVAGFYALGKREADHRAFEVQASLDDANRDLGKVKAEKAHCDATLDVQNGQVRAWQEEAAKRQADAAKASSDARKATAGLMQAWAQILALDTSHDTQCVALLNLDSAFAGKLP